MDPTLKSTVLGLRASWPICTYSRISRRHRKNEASGSGAVAISVARRILDLLAPLDGWSRYPEIAIDGMNGTGKSSLIRSMNREYVKINELIPHVTNGSSYNHDPLKSMQYLMLPQLTVCENVCWDRCCYSNLIFYFVHQLMYLYRDRAMPTNTSDLYPELNTLAIGTNLLRTLTLMESMKKTPTIFFVCSDLELIGEALCHRNTPNDVYNSKERHYQLAQYHVYRYFGEILKCPTFDLVDMFRLGLTLGDFHSLLRRKIDTPATTSKRGDEAVTDESDGVVRRAVSPPDVRAAVSLNEFLDAVSGQETLLYDYSNK